MKGFVLTIDALIALALAATMFTITIGILPQTAESNFDKKQLYNIGNDILIFMDKTGELKSYIGSSTANEEMGYFINLLPPNLCGNITVMTYTGSVGPPAAFNVENIFTNQTQNCQKKDNYIINKRLFADFENQGFGIAKIELWLR